MKTLGTLVQKVRSKNAGPFWLTIDIFCGSEAAYQEVLGQLKTQKIAQVLGANTQDIKRFDIPSLNVIKISLPRPTIQGSIKDRDMHGASWAALIAEMNL
ncbi:DUF4387 family protein [Sulfitobacter sp. SK011]|uniref:DUF4387 family protein n=1 Tax=Sulfitobacter sp. SK011 TaxID=1389004 RepID=UPI000E0C3FDF|nr:DUF4387 family protein [Sulfitobacter sp. SK011]AXI43212.1 DUF4387 domain-containing protein [Sulfitobacter sp. SK011]